MLYIIKYSIIFYLICLKTAIKQKKKKKKIPPNFFFGILIFLIREIFFPREQTMRWFFIADVEDAVRNGIVVEGGEFRIHSHSHFSSPLPLAPLHYACVPSSCSSYIFPIPTLDGPMCPGGLWLPTLSSLIILHP